MFLVGGTIFGGLWYLTGLEYREQNRPVIEKTRPSKTEPQVKPPPLQPSTTIRRGIKNPLPKEEPTTKEKMKPQPAAEKPPGQGFHEKPSENITFSLGGGGMHTGVSLEALKKRDSTPFQLGGFVPVRIHIKDDVPYCDVTLWGGQRKPPVEVKENEFSVTPSGWDRNFTTNALEVVDEKGVPIFQMIRKTQTHYVANGYFVFPGGIVVATDKGTSIINNPNRVDVPVGALSPIFKYPSWKYPGKYADNSN